VIAGLMELIPSYLVQQPSTDRHLSYELRFKGPANPRYRLEIAGNTATVGAAGESVDCRLTADPVAFLKVGYGRVSQVQAALRGQIRAGGRKPWLGFAFGNLIASP
jgi:putative sterol carrier protein